jgi:hypothetical protein
MPGRQEVRPKSGDAKMRPPARLISLIGDEMVSDNRVSVVELVNSKSAGGIHAGLPEGDEMP